MILEQRNLFPVFPQQSHANYQENIPIEYSQMSEFMINEDWNPDIIITPSDLTTFTKVIHLLLYCYSVLKEDFS